MNQIEKIRSIASFFRLKCNDRNEKKHCFCTDINETKRIKIEMSFAFHKQTTSYFFYGAKVLPLMLSSYSILLHCYHAQNQQQEKEQEGQQSKLAISQKEPDRQQQRGERKEAHR